jgi:acetyl-CoA synthetase
VTVWYNRADRHPMLMTGGLCARREHELSGPHFSPVWAPVNPEAVIWSQEVFGRCFHDNW